MINQKSGNHSPAGNQFAEPEAESHLTQRVSRWSYDPSYDRFETVAPDGQPVAPTQFRRRSTNQSAPQSTVSLERLYRRNLVVLLINLLTMYAFFSEAL